MHFCWRENHIKFFFLENLWRMATNTPVQVYTPTLIWELLSSAFTASALEFVLSALRCLRYCCLHLCYFSRPRACNWQPQGLKIWLHEQVCCQPTTADAASAEYIYPEPLRLTQPSLTLCGCVGWSPSKMSGGILVPTCTALLSAEFFQCHDIRISLPRFSVLRCFLIQNFFRKVFKKFVFCYFVSLTPAWDL